MSCTNCFSGCVETTSDKCVKYTGEDIQFLNIHTGDTLLTIENAITDYLATVFNGTGIFPVIDPTHLCEIVSQYFPCAECGNPTLIDILTAIIRAICDVEAEIIVERGRINVIEAEYNVGCLTVPGVDLPFAGTHAVLEAAITALCTAIGDIATLNELFATCITTANINTYIQNYINTQSDSHMYTKMVPYVIYPFYPTVAIMTGAFDINGVGLGNWEKIYLCNGYGGKTPDLRGRSLIGTTDMGGGPFNPDVDPGLGNPAYTLGTLNGQNSVILSPSQMAAHTHTAVASVSDPGHKTTLKHAVSTDDWPEYTAGPVSAAKPVLNIEDTPGTGGAHTIYDPVPTLVDDKTGITVGVSVDPMTGGGNAHTNVHPVHATYYIMYVP